MDNLDLINAEVTLGQLIRTDFHGFADLVGRVARQYRNELLPNARRALDCMDSFGHADYENGAEFADNPDFDDAREHQAVLDLYDNVEHYC